MQKKYLQTVNVKGGIGMKKCLKKLISLVLTGTMVLASATVVFGAAAPTKIAVSGAPKTMIKGQKADLDSRITPANAYVRDSRIVWNSSDSKVIKVLDKYDDDTEIKALKAGKATITVSVKGTNLKAQKEITVKEAATTSSSSYAKKIAAYKSDLKAILKSIKSTAPAGNADDKYDQVRKFEKKIDKIEDKLDTLEERIEAQYRAGKLSRSQFRKLENKLEAAEDYASDIEDYLEDKFGDFDDYDDDDYDD